MYPDVFKVVFGDICMMGNVVVNDKVSNAPQVVESVDINSFGTSCINFSLLSTTRDDYSRCVEDASGTSGSTIAGHTSYVHKRPYIVGFQEQVRGPRFASDCVV